MKIKFDYKANGIEVGEIASCPFCGMQERLTISDPESYEKLVAENGSSVIVLRCRGCNMELSQHSIPNNNYMLGVGLLLGRWNHRA